MRKDRDEKYSGIFGKMRKIFDFLGDIYFNFRVTDYKHLSELYSKQIKKGTELSGEVGRLTRRTINLSGQYEKEKEKVNQLSIENKGLTNTAFILSTKLSELEESVTELTEQRNIFSAELAENQSQISEYKKGVLESPPYKELEEARQKTEAERDDLEKRVQELEKAKKDIDGLYGVQKQITIKLQREFRNRYEEHVKETEKLIINRARESDKSLSYVMIRDLDEIMVVTPEFEEKYHFKDEEIRGKRYFNVLKNANVRFVQDLRKLFKDPKEIKKQTIIIDGKKEDRVIYFVRHSPEVVKGLIPDDKGNLVEHGRYYTRVDVHDFGFVEKTKTGFYKIIHRNGEPRTLQEFIEQQHLKEIQENEINKKIEEFFPRWAKEGITVKETEEIEDTCKNYKDFRLQVAKLLSKKRKEKRVEPTFKRLGRLVRGNRKKQKST